MNRAYSVLNIKSLNEGERTIKGMATTPSVDRVGDIIDPMGVSFKNPLPFLWQHKHDQPVGTVTFSKPTKDGIEFEAKIAQIDEPGTLKDRVDEAWQSIKAGLVRAVSVGFAPHEYSYIDGGGIHFTKSEVFELSAVTIPANAEALITTIKSLDTGLREDAGVIDDPLPEPLEPAASGTKVKQVRLAQPPAMGQTPFVIRSIKRTAP